MNMPHAENDNLAARLLEEALSIEDPAARAGHLEKACAGNQTLLSEVMSLLQFATVWNELAPKEDGFVGTKVGKYEIKSEIGRGGMGTVYRGVRTQDYKQVVAVKIINRELLSQEAVRQFSKEMQIMARLNHPNMARLLDAGATDNGLPFVVMECIEGQRIDNYCDNNKLTVRERLLLFGKVCSVVSYIHDNEIVHRDIKPSNILVTESGEPKLIDFGIAKVLNSALDTVTYTRFQRAFSPYYASPEQLRGYHVGKAADVYSLGAVLYKLLTGHRAHKFADNNFEEVVRVICEAEVARPSKVIFVEEAAPGGGNPPLTPESVSAARGSTPKKLRRQLAGDLDAIVAVAMCKTPRHRYESIRAFAADVDNHLHGRRTLARKGAWWKSLDNVSRRLANNLPPTSLSPRPKLLSYLLLVLIIFLVWQSPRLRDWIETEPPLHATSIGASLPGSRRAKRESAVKELADNLGTQLSQNLSYFKPWDGAQAVVGSMGRANFSQDAARQFLAQDMIKECSCYSWNGQWHVAESGWVILAMLKLNKAPSPGQVDFIVNNQNPEGWWRLYPQLPDSRRNASTYATAYALLALHEYLRSGRSAQPDEEKIRSAIERGQRWLIDSHIDGAARWWDAPNQPDSPERKASVGLSGLALHVLHRTKATEKFKAQVDDLDRLWRLNLPPERSDIDYDESKVALDGGGTEDPKNIIMPWAVIATADAYAGGTQQEKEKTVLWMRNVLDNLKNNTQVLEKPSFIKAEWLIALRYASGDIDEQVI